MTVGSRLPAMRPPTKDALPLHQASFCGAQPAEDGDPEPWLTAITAETQRTRRDNGHHRRQREIQGSCNSSFVFVSSLHLCVLCVSAVNAVSFTQGSEPHTADLLNTFTESI